MIIIRGIAAILIGIIAGSLVNIGLVIAGSSIIPPPMDVDVTDPQSIAAAMDQFQPRHFVFPFLAHALGTLTGALTAFLVTAVNRRLFAWVIGFVFLAGGIINASMIPTPAWFLVLDLVAAYLPMAWLGVWLGIRIGSRFQATGMPGERPGERSAETRERSAERPGEIK